jgi:hypothetical protein
MKEAPRDRECPAEGRVTKPQRHSRCITVLGSFFSNAQLPRSGSGKQTGCGKRPWIEGLQVGEAQFGMLTKFMPGNLGTVGYLCLNKSLSR